MARYTDPRCRLCRRVNSRLMLKGERCASSKCAIERRGMPPGPHKMRRRRLSDRGIQLREKQKARFIYGVLERQFRKMVAEAEKKPGVTGDYLIQLLERRLDNTVYRLGFAESRSQARQIVRHGHLCIDGRKVNIPSMMVKVGDTITWKEGKKKSGIFQQIAETAKVREVPAWLSRNVENMEGRVITLPEVGTLLSEFDSKSIVEYYSR